MITKINVASIVFTNKTGDSMVGRISSDDRFNQEILQELCEKKGIGLRNVSIDKLLFERDISNFIFEENYFGNCSELKDLLIEINVGHTENGEDKLGTIHADGTVDLIDCIDKDYRDGTVYATTNCKLSLPYKKVFKLIPN